MLLKKTMNNQKKQSQLNDLPGTNNPRAKRLWNPDGEAFQEKVQTDRPRAKTECGNFRVENNFIVCQKCQQHHTIQAKNIEKFIDKNKSLMAPLTKHPEVCKI